MGPSVLEKIRNGQIPDYKLLIVAVIIAEVLLLLMTCNEYDNGNDE